MNPGVKRAYLLPGSAWFKLSGRPLDYFDKKGGKDGPSLQNIAAAGDRGYGGGLVARSGK